MAAIGTSYVDVLKSTTNSAYDVWYDRRQAPRGALDVKERVPRLRGFVLPDPEDGPFPREQKVVRNLMMIPEQEYLLRTGQLDDPYNDQQKIAAMQAYNSTMAAMMENLKMQQAASPAAQLRSLLSSSFESAASVLPFLATTNLGPQWGAFTAFALQLLRNNALVGQSTRDMILDAITRYFTGQTGREARENAPVGTFGQLNTGGPQRA